MLSRKFWRFRFIRWMERRSTRSMRRQRTARRRPTRPRRFSLVACRKIRRSMRWRLTSASSARSRRLWCWWINRPSVTVVSDSLVLLTVSLPWTHPWLYFDDFQYFRGRCRPHLWNSLPHHQEQESWVQEGSTERDCYTSHTATVAEAFVIEWFGAPHANRNGRRSTWSRSHAVTARRL